MADESIIVEVKDKVDDGISSKLRAIARDAREAQGGLNSLQRQINSLNANRLRGISNDTASAAAALNRLTSSGERLVTQQQKTATATAATARANAQAATAAEALATQQAKTAQAAALTAAANDRAALVALRLKQAQDDAAKKAADLANAQKKNATATAAAGMSQKQYNAALRGVPAQITDIVVSLQGGQRPLTVLLQQGGQLKDMFGGIGPAVRALGSELLKLARNPVVIALAAIGSLIALLGIFESKARSLNSLSSQFKATGRNDVGISEIKELQSQISQLPGVSKSAAADTIKAFADVRGVGGEQLKQASLLVADFAKATGDDVPTASKKLAEALNDPIKGIEALDKQLGLFTISDFKAVDALSKAGKTAEAQQYIINKLATEYKDFASNSMTPLEKATDNLGNAWNKFTGTLSDSSVLKVVSDGLAGLVNGLTWIIEKLDALFSMKPPSWFGGDLESMFGAQKNSVGFTGSGATGSFGGPVNTAPKQFGQTTDNKMRAASLKGSQDKSGERRASALEKINKELNNEIKLLGLVGPAREEQMMFDRIEESLIGRKITLTAEESKSIKERIARIVHNNLVQGEMNRLYEEALGPINTYRAASEANDKLLEQGLITDTKHQRNQIITEENYENAIDPMRQYNKSLKDQLDLTRMLPDDMAVESQFIQLRNQLLEKGIVLNGTQAKVEKDKIKQLQEAQRYQESYNQIYNQTSGALKQIQFDTVALTSAYQNGLVSAESYVTKMNQLAVSTANVRLAMGQGTQDDVMLSSLGRLLDGYQNVLTGLSSSFGDFFTSLSDGFANSIGRAIVYSESLGDALNAVAKEALSGLIGALVKLGVQYVVNAALGESVGAAALATQTAASVTAAGITATAWAPAAALVSLASFGSNAIPAEAGILSTSILSKAVAASGALGFESGGYTGNGGTSQVAGVVHGQEFVMNAAATDRIGVANLEALQSGAASLGNNSQSVGIMASGPSQMPQIIIENHGTPQTYDSPQWDEGKIRILARDELRKNGDKMVASNIANSSSRTSKTMNSKTNVQRKR